jgi:PAS domain S-box-containing protein
MPINQEKKTGKLDLVERGNPWDEFLRAIVETSAWNIAVLDESAAILYTSKAWRQFEKTNSLIANQHDTAPYYFEECKRFTSRSFDEKANAALSDDIQQILVGKEREFHRKYAYYGLTEPRNFLLHAARLNLPGSAFRVLLMHDDVISPRDALRKSEENLGQLLETTKLLVWEADAESWLFTYVSEQAVKMLGYPIEQWYEPDFLALHIHRHDLERTLSWCLKQFQVADQYDLTFRMLAKDGRVVWLRNLVSITRENGKPKRMRGFMIDISERKRAEEALREISGRLIAAQEDERRRVARELHDDLNQRMVLLSIGLEQLGQEIQEPLNLRRRLQNLQTQAQEISADIHRLSYKLHPSKLDYLGLGAAVQGLCEELSESRKLKIEVHQIGFPATLPKDVTLCVFRIVQEALRNCVRHSGAQTAQVVLEKTSDAIRLSVSDNGCGFDTESGLMTKGLGFVSMRERLHIVGGVMHIYSQPLRGTRIEVSVPLTRYVESGHGYLADEEIGSLISLS